MSGLGSSRQEVKTEAGFARGLMFDSDETSFMNQTMHMEAYIIVFDFFRTTNSERATEAAHLGLGSSERVSDEYTLFLELLLGTKSGIGSGFRIGSSIETRKRI